jgi:hypothetical protein
MTGMCLFGGSKGLFDASFNHVLGLQPNKYLCDQLLI